MKRQNVLDWNTYFMALAHLSAERSKDPNTNVGAVIVDDMHRIVSMVRARLSGTAGDKVVAALYGSDDLTTWEAVKTGTHESGTPAAQAQGTAEKPVDKVELSITVTPGDSAAGPKRFYKVVSGATSEPLAE